MMRRTVLLFTAALAAVPALATAQGSSGIRGRRTGPPPQRADSARPDRAALEAQVRQRFGEMLRRTLGLGDDQMQKVLEINGRYAERRRLLMEQERGVRMSLREEITTGDSSRQKQVADLLDRMMQTQRQRMDVIEAEQRELASVLTPRQRAQYIGIEEQIRQRVEGMWSQGGRGGRGGRRPGDGPPL